jgi:hypothetical protein
MLQSRFGRLRGSAIPLVDQAPCVAVAITTRWILLGFPSTSLMDEDLQRVVLRRVAKDVVRLKDLVK